MKLSPRYDDPVIRFDIASEIRAPFLAQRDRFGAALADLTPEQWDGPTRCDGWTAVDVASHLATVNRFWHLSIGSGVGGAPTRFLTDFDPQATPAALVAAGRQQGRDAIVAEYRASDRDLVDLVAGLDGAAWDALAEGPAGHLPVALIVHHALWDAWVHERDVLLPLGLAPTVCDDEVRAALRYAAALGPGLVLGAGAAVPGSFVVEVTDPDDRFVVEVTDGVRVHAGDAPAGAPTISGPALDIAEILSIRTPASGASYPEATAHAASLATIFALPT